MDFQFFIGLMIHVISGHPRTEEEGQGPPSLPDEWILQRMVSFAAAGLRAKSLALRSGRDLGAAR